MRNVVGKAVAFTCLALVIFALAGCVSMSPSSNATSNSGNGSQQSVNTESSKQSTTTGVANKSDGSSTGFLNILLTGSPEKVVEALAGLEESPWSSSHAAKFFSNNARGFYEWHDLLLSNTATANDNAADNLSNCFEVAYDPALSRAEIESGATSPQVQYIGILSASEMKSNSVAEEVSKIASFDRCIVEKSAQYDRYDVLAEGDGIFISGDCSLLSANGSGSLSWQLRITARAGGKQYFDSALKQFDPAHSEDTYAFGV